MTRNLVRLCVPILPYDERTPLLAHDLTRARLGTTLAFVLCGIMSGTLTVRVPAMTDTIGLTKSQLGIVLLAWAVGGLLAMQGSRPLLHRLGSARLLVLSMPLSALTLVGVAVAPGYLVLIIAAAAFGMAVGLFDISMNAQGAVAENASGRSLMSGFHAGWSIGAIAAGAIGIGAIRLDLSFRDHLILVALASLPVAAALSRTYLPDPGSDDGDAAVRRRLPPVVYVLGVVVFAAFMIEGMVGDWNGLYLRDVLGAPESLAALGYPLFAGGMLAARLAGDRLRRRYGAAACLRFGGIVVALSFAVVITAPVVGVALAGLLVAGVAMATVIPFALSLAGGADPAQSGPAIAQTAAIGYAGLLLGPVLIGFLADATSLRLALSAGLVLGAVIWLSTRYLPADS
ncbi:MFS transporter [Herbidospora mongoliensis]|uniref:MFS transporter n=1 Tax=Herbidospora mongoliensis TaxID=688067 RepID=UPI001471AB0A|nr:MFS transporter [Herbidospora mongoliensis]